jgi:multidrug efflux system outer membrane protein
MNRMTLASVPFVAAAILLAGCVVGPDFKPPTTPSPATWRDQGPTISAPDRLATDWWTMFADETLNDLEVRALSANQDLRKAVARVDENRASLRVAKAARYPAINLNQSYERHRSLENGSTPSEQNQFRATLEGSYEFDLWGRVRRTVESAAAQSAAVEAARDTVLLNLTADVADNYFNLRSLDAEISVLERTLSLREKALEVNQSRLDTGIALPADVSQAETELANVQSDFSEARRRRSVFRNALAVLCGEPASTFEIKTQPLASTTPPEVPAGLPSELLLRRPDVAEAEQTAAAMCAEIGVAKTAFLPSVKLTGYAGFESVALKDLLNSESRIWAIGPSVSLPIFNGGKNRANLKVAEARYEQAAAAYRQNVLGAFRDVEDALANTRAYAEQAEALRRAEESARRTASYFDQRLRGGMIGYLDVLEAQRTLLQAERATVQNHSARYSASVQLIKSLGGGWKAGAQPLVHTQAL